jgi:agmatine deiminase
METPEAPVITPASLGYRMPAEWEPHEATWLSWPRPDGISFPGSYQRVAPTLAKMVDALAGSERVNINVCDEAHEAEVKKQLAKARAKSDHVQFLRIPINEPWCRDHGPIFVTRKEEPKVAIIDWDYNAWGWKYPPFDDDDAVPTRVAEFLGLPVYHPGIVMEGGSIELNGSGTRNTADDQVLSVESEPQSGSQPEGDRAEAL